MKRNSEEKFKVSKSMTQQSSESCWTLTNLESTISFGSKLTREFPNLKIILLKGPLGAGKTSLVKGIAKSLHIHEPITSPTFSLAQHYLHGKRPLIHLDLYRLENCKAANELFLQEEEEAQAIGAIMAVEWPERLNIIITDAFICQLDYISNEEGRTIRIMSPHLN